MLKLGKLQKWCPLMQPCKKIIYKHNEDLENVQRNKKKGEFTSHQVSSN
jgi:hypothetical protein